MTFQTLSSNLTDEINNSPDDAILPNIKDDNVEKLGIDTEDPDSNNKEKQLKATVARFLEDTILRKNLAYWSATVVTGWLVCVMFTVWGQKWPISDTVMIALLGTTTLNILGLSYIVLNGLFGQESKVKSP